MTPPSTSGLLHRLAAHAGGYLRANMQDDVLAHIDLLLHSRASSSLLSSVDGLPDTTDRIHDLPASMPVLQRDVIAAIMHGEPRITRLTPLAPARLRRQEVRLALGADLIGGGAIALSLVLERPARWRVARLGDGKMRRDEPCF